MVLPIREHSKQIVDAVAANPVTVVIGETGSGKTTQIAQVPHARPAVPACAAPRRQQAPVQIPW